MMRRLVVGLAIGATLVGLLGLGAAQAGAAGFTLAPGSPFATGGASPFFVAVGDFNGDNKPDVAVGNGGSANVSVLLGDGSGGLGPGPGSPFATGGDFPFGVAVGDFNNDNKPDVAVVNSFSDSVAVLLGDGSGGLSPAPGSPFASGGNSIAVGDFNGDNKPDLALSNVNGVAVLLGDGSGGLSPAPGSPFASGGSQPFGVAVGDFNGDSKPDVTLGNAGSDTVAVLLGDGSGRLRPANHSPFASGGITPTGVAVGELNGDSKPDVAVSNENSDNLSVLLGSGNGGLRPAGGSPFATLGTSPFGVAVGDFNSDNDSDIAVANYRTNNVSVLLNGRCPARRSGCR